MGTRKNDKHQLFTQIYTNQTTSWLVCSLNVFSVKMSHGQTRIYKTHHGLDLGEAIIFSLIVYSIPSYGTNTQMSFCPRTPKWESRNSQSWDFNDFGLP
jgi:hypothetical protein